MHAHSPRTHLALAVVAGGRKPRNANVSDNEIWNTLVSLANNPDVVGKALLVHTLLKKPLKPILVDLIEREIAPKDRAIDSLYNRLQKVLSSYLDGCA